MAGKQLYNQACPLATALDVVGSRWALLIVRELVLGPRRFKDIHAGLQSASTDMVTSRLRELEASGHVARTHDRRYELTPQGRRLLPVLRSLATFAFKGTDRPIAAGAPAVDPVRRLVGIIAMANGTAPPRLAAGTYQIRAGDLAVLVSGTEAGFRLAEGTATEIDGTIEIGLEALINLAFGDMTPDDLFENAQAKASNEGAAECFRRLVGEVRTAIG